MILPLPEDQLQVTLIGGKSSPEGQRCGEGKAWAELAVKPWVVGSADWRLGGRSLFHVTPKDGPCSPCRMDPGGSPALTPSALLSVSSPQRPAGT